MSIQPVRKYSEVERLVIALTVAAAPSVRKGAGWAKCSHYMAARCLKEHRATIAQIAANIRGKNTATNLRTHE